MAEHGGSTTQDGIFYQNTVAARSLADLLDLRHQPPRERVVEVRLEAPADVDDIVVMYADGHRDWIQAKTRVRVSSKPWKGMWADLATQFSRADFISEDRLVIVMGDADETARSIRDMAERALTSVDASEWIERLSEQHKKILATIEPCLGGKVSTIELLRRTTVEIQSLGEIEKTFERRRLGTAFTLPATFLSVLRDIAGGESRRRSLILAVPLRTRLAKEFGFEVTEPSDWGLPAYRSTIQRLAQIEIPGTGISGSSEELFVWPRVRDFDRAAPADFESEQPSLDSSQKGNSVDLKCFPSHHTDRYIIVAGPGYGKSALLNAVAARLASTPYVPVLVPLATFAACNQSVLEFLTNEINRELDVRVDWPRLAEQGSVVPLFDGLDEIPSNQRKAVLNRISNFSARHPLAPWLMTVRDPAVISGPADARLVELMPLDSEDIVRFADAMKSRIPDLNGWKFVRRIEAYPDVARLTQIPLFLTMLLAFNSSTSMMPLGRADLIESYLKTLFCPHEHKALLSPSIDPSHLRLVAEALAFSRLEAQEIGATEREVLDTAARIGANKESPDAVLACLLTQGVLRRQSAIRLQFPYPIVQEYLAACYLIRELPEMLSQRIEDAIQRPWAQVVQFALELHPEPSSIIQKMLGRPDDAFSTGLRLVARCIVNGANVNIAIKNTVARLLAPIWSESSWFIRDRIGRIVADGFSTPLLPEIRALLDKHRLVSSGAGDIVTAAKDLSLTREVLNSLLENELSSHMSLHSLQPAIDQLGDEALNIYINKYRTHDLSDDQISGLASLIGSLNPSNVTPNLALGIACDETLTDTMRLEAFYIAGETIDDRAWPIIDRIIRSGNVRWTALKALSKCKDPQEAVLKFLYDNTIALSTREEIAGSVNLVLKTESEQLCFVKDCSYDERLPTSVRYVMLLLSARHNDEQAFRFMVEHLGMLESRFAEITISLFGHYPNRDLGLNAASFIRARVQDSQAASAFADRAVIGMTCIFEMDSFGCGVLEPAPQHPAQSIWADLVDSWMDRNDSSEIQKISITLAALKLGSTRAIDRLKNLIYKLEDPDDARFDEEDEYGHKIRSAIDELHRMRNLIPLSLAERFARSKRPNIPFAGINAIAAHGNRSALDLLIELHNDQSKTILRSATLGAIESIASRLETVVIKTGKHLAIMQEN